MPLFGAHMSIAGGLHKAVEAAARHEMDTVQIFTHSPSQWAVKSVAPTGQELLRDGKSLTKGPNQWNAKDLTDEDVHLFRTALQQSRLQCPLAHDSYLINLASPDDSLYRRSVEAFVAELQRAEQLGLAYLVTHPGAHVGSGAEAGLTRVVQALDEVHRRCPRLHVQVLLETTAGQGSSLGWRFEELAWILERVAETERLGVCFDTCHVHAAGYALAPQRAYRATLREFDQVIGLHRLKAFHLNDSVKPLGSRVDRHAHLGKGGLGLEPFRLLVNDRRFRNHPMVLETPKESEEATDMDAVNLGTLRALVAERIPRSAGKRG